MGIVNIEEAKKEFIKFTKNYDLTIESIKRKQDHSLRVMEISTKIAQEENFTEEEVEIATLIGLLHDIARFKQYTEYHTFRDAISFDHGDVGVEILEKDNYLRKFIKTDRYDEIIKLAIKNHNKFSIEDELTEEKNRFCKLIRDADKIDILFQKTERITGKKREEMENSKLDLELKKEFDKGRTIDRKKYPNTREYADKIIGLLALIFDINYKSSFEILKKEEYVDKIVNRVKFKDAYTREAIVDAKNKVNQYILSKIQE